MITFYIASFAKCWEILLLNHCWLLLSLSFMLWLVLTFLFMPYRCFLTEKSKIFKVLVMTYSAWSKLNNILSISFTNFLILFRLKNCKFFLFNPFSIQLPSFDRCFFLKSVANFNSFIFIVLFKSQSFRFLWFLFNNRLLYRLLFTFNWSLCLRLTFLCGLF